eukprot:865294-Rhodomonas_salina.1
MEGLDVQVAVRQAREDANPRRSRTDSPQWLQRRRELGQSRHQRSSKKPRTKSDQGIAGWPIGSCYLRARECWTYPAEARDEAGETAFVGRAGVRDLDTVGEQHARIRFGKPRLLEQTPSRASWSGKGLAAVESRTSRPLRHGKGWA